MIILLAAPAAQSAVTVSFDSTVEGFVAASGSIAHSSQGGGSVQITRATNWGNNSAEFQIQSNGSFRAEFEDAVANGGTLSFEVTIVATDYDPGDAPNWFEVVLNPNTELDGFGGNLLANPGFDFSTLQADGSQTRSVVVDVADFSTYANLAGSSWGNVHFGTNNDGANIAGDAIVYIDNLTVSAIPEPSGALLALFGAGILLRRRRAQ